MKFIKYYLLIICLLHINNICNAQIQTPLDLALRTLESQSPSLGLTSQDIADLAVSDLYRSEHNGITHIYFNQRYKGIPIHNAITSYHVDLKGKVYDSPSRFYGNLEQRINTKKPRISESEALVSLVKYLKIPNALVPKNITRGDEGRAEFIKTNFTHSNIPVKLVFMPLENGQIRLAWDMNLDMSTSDDYWSVRIDALNGDVLDLHNLTIKCSFDHPGHQKCISEQNAFKRSGKPVKQVLTEQNTSAALTAAPNSYKVVALPAESPKHADRSLVVNPAHPVASPFGWHDTNGLAGAEYQITRGNNVHAYLDRNGDNLSDGNEPNGGSELIFDFPFDPAVEPFAYTDAATTNLFYMCNMMHDFSYIFGFNEAAGNFQMSNYGKGGSGNDFVRAEAQDGSGIDNANFSTPADGNNGRMQMFLWLAAQEETYIAAPDSLIGAVNCRRGSFGTGPTDIPLVADVVIGNDRSATPNLGCANGFRQNEVGGKIVLIDRGTCEFGLKSLNAQRAGAAAVIICNFEDVIINMGGGAVGGQVTIPAYFTTKTICDRLKMYVNNGGLKIEIRKPGANAGPDSLDGDFDNGIIAHEYGHGISNRLTGGPSNSGCLGNGEQMGEGWSDFMTLITSVEPGDQGSDRRGIGTYAQNEDRDGYGIRRRQYSTDMSVNEFTYKNMTAEVHDLGEIWTIVCWDLYWAMVDRYGYDADLSNKNSGNFKAVQLVFDGMKLQPCRPGMIDGRNAILRADTINYAGANACLIWEVFARRGMGYFASQGSNNMVGDEKESFLAAPICIDRILLSKRAGYYKDVNTFIKNDVVKAGSEFSVTLEINNFKPGAATNVIITDKVPEGCTYVPGSASIAPQINGNELKWTIPSMASLATQFISYKLASSPSISSSTLWIDDIEAGEDNWDIDISKGTQLWYRDEGFGVDQSFAWIAEEKEGTSNDFTVFTYNPFKLNGTNPSLLFYHFFNTEQGIDGGVVEVSTDGSFWKQAVKEDFSLNTYTGILDYGTFVTPNSYAFSGQSGDFIPSVLDLSAYNGQDVQIRFRFGNDSLGVSPDRTTILGWVVDNVEFIEPKFYNSEVCLTTTGGDNECASIAGKGVLADSDKIVGSENVSKIDQIRIYPNPGSEYAIVRMDPELEIRQLKFLNLNGQVLKIVEVDQQGPLLKVDIKDLPRGILFLELNSSNSTYVKKLIIK